MDAVTILSLRRSRNSGGSTKIPHQQPTEQENATVEVGATLAVNSRKLRSKSVGPGGFDALKASSGNRRASLAAPMRPVPRSILKPTLPPSTATTTIAITTSTTSSHSPARRSRKRQHELYTIDLGSHTTMAPTTRVAVRSEAEQQSAAREREKLEKDITERREARRKSLANRRVSFAAEATLHTFHEIEYMNEHTASTEHTQRRSSLAPSSIAGAGSARSGAVQNGVEMPLSRRTPAEDTTMSSDSEPGDEVINEQIVEDEGSDSSTSEDEGTMMTVDEVTGASVVSGRTVSRDATDDVDDIDEALHHARQVARSNTVLPGEDDDEEIVPGLLGWGKSVVRPALPYRSTSELAVLATGSKENAQPDTTDMDVDETRPLGRIIQSVPQAMPETAEDEDDLPMEMTTVLGHVQNHSHDTHTADHTGNLEEEEMTMELTGVVGRVLHGRQSLAASVQRQREDSGYPADITTEVPIDTTVPLGRILTMTTSMESERGDGDATMAMDLTTPVGAIISRRGAPRVSEAADATVQPTIDIDMDMELTTTVGRILPRPPSSIPVPSARKPRASMADMAATAAPTKQPSIPLDNLFDSSPFKMMCVQNPAVSASPACRPIAMPRRVIRSSASSTPQQQLAGSSRNSDSLTSGTPELNSHKLLTSVNELKARKSIHDTIRQQRAEGAAPCPRNEFVKHSVASRTDDTTGKTASSTSLTPRKLTGIGADRRGLGSPKVLEMLDRHSIIESALEFSPIQLNTSKWATRDTEGNTSSNTGSTSLSTGTSTRRLVAFEDPKTLITDVDRRRSIEADREDTGSGTLTGTSDGNTTVTLREMIEGMSPARSARFRPLRGRKSLAMGSGKALLGKRPAELDDSDIDDSDTGSSAKDGVKRLKNHQGSPVKNVRLRHPPSKAETTGRVALVAKKLEPTAPAVSTPLLQISPVRPVATASTPRSHGRFRDAPHDSPIDVHFDESRSVMHNGSQESPQQDDSSERIHLQDFLNMTSIRFMELTTTKRRATIAADMFANKSIDNNDSDESALAKRVVAAACTVPLLELYQHSCQELSKYISEGRKIVREIEAETLQFNPPLFREYMNATPEFKQIMDNQFKHVKTYARLQSKAMWYEWRTKLQASVKQGLEVTAAGMTTDSRVLSEQQAVIDAVLPGVEARHAALVREAEELEAHAAALADSDPSELAAARAQLAQIESSVEAKRARVAAMRAELADINAAVDSITSRKLSCIEAIRNAEVIRDRCRGWSAADVAAAGARVAALEARTGWAVARLGIIASTSSSALCTLTYRRQLSLTFDALAYATSRRSPAASAAVALTAASKTSTEVPPEHRFFLALIQANVRAFEERMPQTKRSTAGLLACVARSWDTALLVARDIRLLCATFPTIVEYHDDGTLRITCSMLVVPVRTKVEVVFMLAAEHDSSAAIEVLDADPLFRVDVGAHVVYGEQFNEQAMWSFLQSRLGDGKSGGNMSKEKEKNGRTVRSSWCDVVVDLQQRLVASGKKGLRVE